MKPLSVLLLTLTVACDRRTPLPQVEPFKELIGVDLGISAKDLITKRQVRNVGYVGFVEDVPGGTWLYHMSGKRLHEEDPPSSRSQLQAVQFQEDVPNGAGLASHYRLVQEMQRRLGRPPSCRTRFAAVWKTDGGKIVTTYQPNYTAVFFEKSRRDVSNVSKRACR